MRNRPTKYQKIVDELRAMLPHDVLVVTEVPTKGVMYNLINQKVCEEGQDFRVLTNPGHPGKFWIVRLV